MNSITTDLHYLELLDLAAYLRKREVSSAEVTRSQLERITRLDSHLGSYALTTPEEALASAARADAEIAVGKYRGPLHGVPIGIKDLFYTKGIRTMGGMIIYRDFYPDEDATVVARLREAGAIVLGKLQMTEGAYSDHHPSVVPPKNPWNKDYWTGISSSGPAVATAVGLCYGSPASDNGGSIRWPSAALGLTGIKPTWGRVSRFGMFELAASLDHVGTIARSAADAAAMLQVIAGPDAKDPTTLVDPMPDSLCTDGIRGLRIGVDENWNCEDVDDPVRKVLANAIGAFDELGAILLNVSVPDTVQSVVDWPTACAVEAAVAHEASYPKRKQEYGPVLASVLERGRATSAIDFQKTMRRRAELRRRFTRLFQKIDVLLVPVQPFAPLGLGTIRSLGEQPELILKLQRFTAPFDMTGNPTITVPGGFSEAGLPVGFQLVADHLHELQLVSAAKAFQAVTPWHRRHPPEQGKAWASVA